MLKLPIKIMTHITNIISDKMTIYLLIVQLCQCIIANAEQ